MIACDGFRHLQSPPHAYGSSNVESKISTARLLTAVTLTVALATACTSPTNPNKRDDTDRGPSDPNKTGMIVPADDLPGHVTPAGDIEVPGLPA